jgi:hypothetical protein
VIDIDADVGDESPVAFLPITVKVYAVPFVKPVTLHVVVDVVHVKPPGLDVAM